MKITTKQVSRFWFFVSGFSSRGLFLWVVVFIADCLLPAADCFSQDIHFSQFYMNPLAINPAGAGAEKKMQAVFQYKDQWRSVGSPYKTMAASSDIRIEKKKNANGFWAGGISFFSDKAGDIEMKSLQAGATAAHHLYLTGKRYSTLGLGLQSGLSQRSLSYQAVSWGSQYDGHGYNSSLPAGEPASGTSHAYADLGAGVVWTYNNTAAGVKVTDNQDIKASLGFSLLHIIRPNYSFYQSGEKLYMKYVLHGSALITIPGSTIALAPGFMYFKQGPAQEIYAGSLIRYKLRQDSKYTGFYSGQAISAGAFFRTKDAIVIVMLLEHSSYALGMSYDVNVSGLKTATMGRGGFELSLRYHMSDSK